MIKYSKFLIKAIIEKRSYHYLCGKSRNYLKIPKTMINDYSLKTVRIILTINMVYRWWPKLKWWLPILVIAYWLVFRANVIKREIISKAILTTSLHSNSILAIVNKIGQ